MPSTSDAARAAPTISRRPPLLWACSRGQLVVRPLTARPMTSRPPAYRCPRVGQKAVISTGLRGRDRPTASSIVSKIRAYWFESCPVIVSAGCRGVTRSTENAIIACWSPRAMEWRRGPSTDRQPA
jgi:hypothetical protein